MSNLPWPPTACPRLRAAGPSAGGLLHSPLHGDPNGLNLGLLGLQKSAAPYNATAPWRCGRSSTKVFPVTLPTAGNDELVPCFRPIVSDAIFSRLIVTCPPRLGKSLLISSFSRPTSSNRHPHLFAAIAKLIPGELAYAIPRTRHFYRASGSRSP